jgi:hypothetical protein
VRQMLDPALIPEIERLSGLIKGHAGRWLPR